MKVFISLAILAVCATDSLAQPAGAAAARRGRNENVTAEGYDAVEPPLAVHSGIYVGPSGKPRKVSYQIINGRARFEGDIDLGPVDAEGRLLARVEGPTAVGTNQADRVWPDCVVPWRFAAGVPPALRGVINNAITTWQTSSPCRFPARAGQRDYVTFVMNTDANGASSSPVGRLGGEQEISINQGVTNQFTVVHEIGHTLGLFHEQTRHDRDTFVTVQWANIASGAKHNFEIDKDSQDLGLYNFNSVMHYPPTAFSNPKGAITLMANTAGVTFGQRSSLDPGDVSGALEVQAMYRYWSSFEPSPAPPRAAAPAVIGPFTESIYYESVGAGVRLCRRHFPWYPPADCGTTPSPEALAGVAAATISPRAKGEVAVFVRGSGTGDYLDFRRDYITNAVGGDFRLQPAVAGKAWLSSPAAITLDKRILVFGVRGREDHPGETVVALVFKEPGDAPWSSPIALPPLPDGHQFDPAVVSTRPGIWTLFIFDSTARLWATEGDRDGKIVTAWKLVSDFNITGAGPQFAPTATLTSAPGYEILLAVTGGASHLFFAGVDPKLNLTNPWRDVGGLVTSRPSAAGAGTGAYVIADFQNQPHWWRVWRP